MISDREWAAILSEIDSRVPGSQFVIDTVAQRDEKNRFIYATGFPGIPVPLIGFRGKVKYYDHNGTATLVKHADIEIEVPKIGESVLLVRGLGPSGTVRCLGVILSTGYMTGQ